MPYKVKGKCIYKKDTGKKVGCTKGSVKKYLAALHANVKESEKNILNFKDFFFVEHGIDVQNKNRILLEVSQKYIDKINEVKKELPFKNIFGDDLRIVIPLGGTSTYNDLVDEIKKIPNFSSLDIDKKEIVRKFKTRTPQGEGEKEQRISLGKAISSLKISPEKKKEFLNWFSEYSTNLKSMEDLSEYSIILSRSPIDVLRMSDIGSIQSCHSQGGSYFHCAIQEAKTGGPIAYVVRSEDIKGLTKKELNEDEIFKDTQRDINGISALSRIRIRRYVMDDGRELAIPETRKYGLNISGFYDTIKNFIKSKQNIPFEDIQANYSKKQITRTGGSYMDRDISDGSLFNTMYDVNIFYKSLPFESGDEGRDIEERFERELSGFKKAYTSKLKHCSVYYDLQVEDYGDGAVVYYYAGGSVEIPLHGAEFNEDINNVDSDFFEQVYNSIGRKPYRSMGYYREENPEGWDYVLRFLTILDNLSTYKKDGNISENIDGWRLNPDTNTLVLSLKFTASDGESNISTNTNEFSYFCQTVAALDSKFEGIKDTIKIALIKSGNLKNEDVTYDIFDKDADSIFKNIKNLAHDSDSSYFTLKFKTYELPNNIDKKSLVNGFEVCLGNFIRNNFKYNPEIEDLKQLKFTDMFESFMYQKIDDLNGLGLSLEITADQDGDFTIYIQPLDLNDRVVYLIYFLDKSINDIRNIMTLCVAKLANIYSDYVRNLEKLYGKYFR